MTIGFDKPLYVLPFDHRATFQTKMFGWKGTLTPAQSKEIIAAKRVIYDGFKAAVAAGVPKEKAAILVDEQFGSDILRDAAKNGFSTAYTVEKSGQEEFDFEYGEEFARHIEAFNPTFAKVLVRYNPEGDRALNQRQASRLKRLSDYLHGSGRMFMFELLVPETKRSSIESKGTRRTTVNYARPDGGGHPPAPGLRRGAGRLEDRGVDRREDCEKVVAAARRNGRDKVGCIVLGRGEDDEKVREWLAVAASVPGFIGFAVGRTSFWEPLMNWREKKATRAQAVADIARRYREWVAIFEKHSVPVRRAGGG
jgi:5-dehydro-2-deoxygluconokinase